LAKEDVSSIALAKEECRRYNARLAVYACARCSRPTPLGRFRGEAAIYGPFATFGHFTYAVAPDGNALQVSAGPAPGVLALPMYGSISAKESFVLPGELTEIGVWVDSQNEKC